MSFLGEDIAVRQLQPPERGGTPAQSQQYRARRTLLRHPAGPTHSEPSAAGWPQRSRSHAGGKPGRKRPHPMNSGTCSAQSA